MVWGFAGLGKVAACCPAWFPDKFGATALAKSPGLHASFWLLAGAEVLGFVLAVAALLRGDALGRRVPVMLTWLLVWSLLVFRRARFWAVAHVGLQRHGPAVHLSCGHVGGAAVRGRSGLRETARGSDGGRDPPGNPQAPGSAPGSSSGTVILAFLFSKFRLPSHREPAPNSPAVPAAHWWWSRRCSAWRPALPGLQDLHPALQRTTGIVDGHRHGHDLTLEVVRPAKPNGLGVAFMVSGGWKSGTNAFHPWMAAPLLRRGYTVFPVCHVPQPEATVMETFEDVSHALRFIRFHARDYGVDPARLGASGGSAGGHLSLMLATRGRPGPADAPDPVDRASSAVQAVAIFYPVTDLLNLGDSSCEPPRRRSAEELPGGLRSGAEESRRVAGDRPRACRRSITSGSNLPPTLIDHGDADTLVPLRTSRSASRRRPR
jgi:acetyl esterase/lipase